MRYAYFLTMRQTIRLNVLFKEVLKAIVHGFKINIKFTIVRK